MPDIDAMNIDDEELLPMPEKKKKKPNFKENWEKVDEVCPACGQVTKQQKGWTRQNVRRLLKPKWNGTEITITIMLIFVLLMAYMYKVETQQCKDWIKPMYSDKQMCELTCLGKCNMIHGDDTNITEAIENLERNNLNKTLLNYSNDMNINLTDI